MTNEIDPRMYVDEVRRLKHWRKQTQKLGPNMRTEKGTTLLAELDRLIFRAIMEFEIEHTPSK